ncbi:transcriptional repressor LexA [Litoribrevibacter albus]|uniref:LexA repressor n=1 Tax=Litoribrevibacter albus TaxID=1473156 RepID=A0AA37S7U7_9GAMM|nr:transcriptional repressor LexA [Litoribrevibacter albus]GLQ29866.1 LexA repressor [Litoribrevibacter albus]
MIKLTKRQQEVLDVIKAHIDETGYPPTRAEIAKTLGFRSANAAEEHLKALAKKGAIEMMPGTSRGLRIPGYDPNLSSSNDEPEQIQGIPVIGRVAAGSPVLAEEHVDHMCPVQPEFFNPPADYLLRVQGLSMKNVGILDGDLLAVHKTQNVRNGQIVVARIGDDVTVKRLDRKGNIVRLIPENEELDDIVIDTNEEPVFIEGLGVGVIRNGDL